MIMIQGADIHLVEAGPKEGTVVLLLHGASFHSGTWKELGTIDYLTERGVAVVAVDLPGYGRSSRGEADRTTFLAHLLDTLGLSSVVVVAPSMSGGFAFPFLVDHPDRCAGFVPVAPVAVAEYGLQLSRCPVPTLVVWGEADQLFNPSLAVSLAERFSDSQVLILDQAGHPAYLDQPVAWHQALYAFIKGLEH